LVWCDYCQEEVEEGHVCEMTAMKSLAWHLRHYKDDPDFSPEKDSKYGLCINKPRRKK
jgi:hypothetical protein